MNPYDDDDGILSKYVYIKHKPLSQPLQCMHSATYIALTLEYHLLFAAGYPCYRQRKLLFRGWRGFA